MILLNTPLNMVFGSVGSTILLIPNTYLKSGLGILKKLSGFSLDYNFETSFGYSYS